MAHVLFVCRQNAGRSQISRALFEHVAGGRHSASSAGTTPARTVHPQVVAAMSQRGIDLSAAVPQQLTDEVARDADVVVTMGCGDACPYIPGKRYVDWDLADPAAMDADAILGLVAEIEQRVAGLVADLDGDHRAAI